MIRIPFFLLIAFSFLTFSCNSQTTTSIVEIIPELKADIEQKEAAKIPVLNFGTFHMGYTSDANTTEFDEHDKKNITETHRIAAMLAAFKPTVIIIENEAKHDEANQAEFLAYKKKPDMKFENPDEITLVAYEVGRLAGTERIYGIDHKMGYDYWTANEIATKQGNKDYLTYMQWISELEPQYESLNLLDKLKAVNTDEYLDLLIEVNAEIMSHVGTEDDPFLGADQAAEYYKRNIRMYANLNQIELDENDRVFILMGASHTAYFRDFMKRSPKYKMVDTFAYLK